MYVKSWRNVENSTNLLYYAKAFDCVNWKTPYEILNEMGAPAHVNIEELVNPLYVQLQHDAGEDQR